MPAGDHSEPHPYHLSGPVPPGSGTAWRRRPARESTAVNQTIAETLTQDHRRCDRLLAAVEASAGRKDWGAAQSGAAELEAAMEAHFGFEEETLFPPLESATAMAMGPTGVMRMEHRQIRALLGDLRLAADARDGGECLGLLESLHLIIQQHNAKEEAILYPMADEALDAEAPALLGRLGQ